MSRLAIGLLVQTTLMAASVSVAAPVAPELLQKLAAHDQRMDEIKKRNAVITTSLQEQMDKDWKTTLKEESVERVEIKEGKEVKQILRATKNGVDRTEEARKELIEQQNGEDKKSKQHEDKQSETSVEIQMESPFESKEQAKYSFESSGLDPKTSLMHIEFSPKEKGKGYIGEAFVDPEAGELASLFMRPAKTQMFVDSMSVQMQFEARVEGTRMPSKLNFAGEGGIPFFKMKMRSVETYSYEAPAGAKAH